MKKISSTSTFFNKKVFPIIWFGFLGVFVVVSVPAMIQEGESGIPFIVIPVFMAALGYLVMKKLVLDLVDEAWDDGNALVLKNRGKEERIEFSNIVNISYITIMNPPRVTLNLREPCSFGKEATFSPRVGLIPFKKSPLIANLIERVDNARETS